jgi:hypothetical protein
MCTRLRCEDRVPASVRLCTHDCVRPCCVLLRGWHSTKCNRFIDQCATPAGEASTTTTTTPRIRPASLEQVNFDQSQSSSSEGRIECVRALAWCGSEVPTSNYTIFQQPPSSSASKPKGAMATAANKPSTTTGPGRATSSEPSATQPTRYRCVHRPSQPRPPRFCAMSPRALLN